MFKMEYEAFSLKTREPTKEEINEMEFWIKTGCVHDEYLKKVLGDQSIGINAFSNDSEKYILP